MSIHVDDIFLNCSLKITSIVFLKGYTCLGSGTINDIANDRRSVYPFFQPRL